MRSKTRSNRIFEFTRHLIMSNGFHFVGDTLQNVNLCGKWIGKFMSRLLKLTIYCDFVITNVIPRSMIFANFKENILTLTSSVILDYSIFLSLSLKVLAERIFQVRTF